MNSNASDLSIIANRGTTVMEEIIFPPEYKDLFFNKSSIELASAFKKAIENNKKFMNSELIEVPKDGHCLLHSVIQCIKNSQNLDLSKEMMYYVISSECSDNINRYMPYFNGSESQFWLELKRYINMNKYDNSFGDLLPHILANGFNMKLLIADIPSDRDKDTKVYCIKPIIQKENSTCVNCGKFINILILQREKNHYSPFISDCDKIATCTCLIHWDMIHKITLLRFLTKDKLDAKCNVTQIENASNKTYNYGLNVNAKTFKPLLK